MTSGTHALGLIIHTRFPMRCLLTRVSRPGQPCTDTNTRARRGTLGVSIAFPAAKVKPKQCRSGPSFVQQLVCAARGHAGGHKPCHLHPLEKEKQRGGTTEHTELHCNSAATPLSCLSTGQQGPASRAPQPAAALSSTEPGESETPGRN